VAEHGWSLLCVRLIVDRETKQPTLVDVADVLFVNAPEAHISTEIAGALSQDKKGISVPARLNLVSWWFRSDKDVAEAAKARALLVNPEAEIVAGGEFDVDLQEGTGYRAIWPLPQFPLTMLGRHYFFVQRPATGGEHEWENVATLPLDVRARFVETTPVEAADSPAAQRPTRKAGKAKPKRKRSKKAS
jgi:hypothetical protein